MRKVFLPLKTKETSEELPKAALAALEKRSACSCTYVYIPLLRAFPPCHAPRDFMKFFKEAPKTTL